MSMTRKTILASRPAAMVLALTLVAGLTAPFLMLPRVHAAPTPLACTQANQNGCTELSATPPQDTVSVPPNIVLMLDDSGSMARDYMPDKGYLAWNTEALINADNNGVYYAPGTDYLLPPKVDGSLYPQASFTAALVDGFDTGSRKVDLSKYRGQYDDSDGAVQYSIFLPDNASGAYTPKSCRKQGYDRESGAYPGYCYDNDDDGKNYEFTNNGYYYHSQCNSENEYHDLNTDTCYPNVTMYVPDSCTDQNYQGQSSRYDGYCYDATDKGNNYDFRDGGNDNYYAYMCSSEEDAYDGIHGNKCFKGHSFFTYTTGPSGSYVRHYVAREAGDCAAAGLSTAVCHESDAARKNIANWFSYYHTRMLMARSGLMSAFTNLNAKYRFGFASINANAKSHIPDSPPYYEFDDKTSGGGDDENRLAVVQPFGDGSASTDQKTLFWNWLIKESPSGNTPLRKALQAVGEYYKTDQPWSAMPGDPGYTVGSNTKYACRASYTILTTDGFWNGQAPSPSVGNADNEDGDVYSVPSGNLTHYSAVGPFSDSQSDTLADVAMLYWKTDLQPGISNEVAASDKDPASWQHMTTFTMGLGFTPSHITGTAPNGNNPPTIPDIFKWARDGGGVASAFSISNFSWPNPSSNNIRNIADLAHAAVNGHGDFFSAKNPQQLAAGFAKAISDINARNVPPTPAAVNASVLAVGALAFATGYNTGDWSGTLQAMTLKTDGTTDQVLWKAGNLLDSSWHSANYTNRKVYTYSYDATGGTPTPVIDRFQFSSANSSRLDPSETAGLESPALAGGNDTLANRIKFLLGDPTYEGNLYRARTTLLGAIINAEPVYVAGASGNYYDSWPSGAPEAASTAQKYDTFVNNQSSRKGMVYVGANDGMLHAFRAPVPTCTGTIDAQGNCPTYSIAPNAGLEAWAFIPRAVYANLGNLTSASEFHYRPTVDKGPVTRDIFFGASGASTTDNKWHTILVGGVGLGGRGVYALDVTDPSTAFSPSSDILWEFDSDMTIPSGCVSIMGTSADATGCRASDLGYTVSQPNIGRLADGNWVALVPNGYFPDCSTPDTPTGDNATCKAIAAQAPKDASGKPYSALFVMNAQTGEVIAELKTPTNISGVTSFGLATPVMGDYDNDQIDDVAFAGDVQGNLWRFDLSNASASNWKVTLVYKAPTQGAQPITTMPRLFPDPSTNRFMVVFGTGKFLGVGDNSDSTVQGVYGVRDNGSTYTRSDLTEQYLHEETKTINSQSVSVRCVTGSASDSTCDNTATAINQIPASGAGSGGWYVKLQTKTSSGVVNDAGERVVVNPGAIFSSNTVVFETLITGEQSSDPCSPSTAGAILALNATTGGPAGVSSLGGWPVVGARISNARTSGSLPVVSALGGGQAYLPGVTLAPKGTNPLSVDAPIWRRRSWNEIQQNQ